MLQRKKQNVGIKNQWSCVGPDIHLLLMNSSSVSLPYTEVYFT